MHPRVERLPQPSPDYHRFLRTIQRQPTDRVPLIELAIHPEVIRTLLAEPAPGSADPRAPLRTTIDQTVRLHHRLGYDIVKISAPIPWDVQRLAGRDQSALSSGDDQRQWANEHTGPIQSPADFDRYPWPTVADVNFDPVEYASHILPDGMAILGFSGGVLEFSMDLLGMQNFMMATVRQPDLVAAVIERVGLTIFQVFERYCQFGHVCALWLGDDLGHKHGPLISPKTLHTHVFPWYRRYVELAHRHNRPLLLHSCGNLATLMPALVNEIGIDAKHSFEDNILPVEDFYDQWHQKAAVLGGVDVHLLATGSDDAIRIRVRQILQHCAPQGGYAAGSGNSIPNYVPPDSYLTMIETMIEFNERS